MRRNLLEIAAGVIVFVLALKLLGALLHLISVLLLIALVAFCLYALLRRRRRHLDGTPDQNDV